MSRQANLRAQDFDLLAEFIERETGIKTPASKRTMLEGRIKRRATALGMSNVTEYCRYLFDDNGLFDEQAHLINAITTNKTDFFREPSHFRLLQQDLLPKLARNPDWSHDVHIWSAASSIGAEAYSIAMCLAEFSLQWPGTRFEVVGTDISTKVLDVALRGIYPSEMIGPIPETLRGRYLMRPRDGNRNEFRISRVIRQHVSFGQMNLMDRNYPMHDEFDFIFCRNVLIYFVRDVQKRIVANLLRHLRPGGYLFLGHSESMVGIELGLRAVGNSVFVREE